MAVDSWSMSSASRESMDDIGSETGGKLPFECKGERCERFGAGAASVTDDLAVAVCGEGEGEGEGEGVKAGGGGGCGDGGGKDADECGEDSFFVGRTPGRESTRFRSKSTTLSVAWATAVVACSDLTAEMVTLWSQSMLER